MDCNVKFGRPDFSDYGLIFESNQLSNNYYYEKNSNDHSYHIPMSEYPLLYNDFNKKKEVDAFVLRNRSAFMSGNFDKTRYNKISNDNIFEIINRREIYEHVVKKEYYQKVSSFNEIDQEYSQLIEHKVYLINRISDFSIKIDRLKEVLIKFDFFIALPGVVIPEAHNLIEAMSVGCIPIIHETYADLLIPKLENMKNALVYNSLEQFDQIINDFIGFDEKKVCLLRKKVLEYYEGYLTPNAVINNITKENINMLYIQAEHKSLKLLNTAY